MKKLMLLTTCAMVIASAGCTGFSTYDYASARGPMVKFSDRTPTKTVSVVPFADHRSMKYVDPSQSYDASGYTQGDCGSFFLGFIPLMPYGFVQKSEPDKSEDFVSIKRFHFNPANDLASSAYISLKESNLFTNVVNETATQPKNTDYIFKGTVTNTEYSGNVFTYGITYFAAWPLWLLGCPAGSSYNELGVTFTLTERATGRQVWTHTYNGSDYLNHWLYARTGKDGQCYADLMRAAMNRALFDISKNSENIFK